MSGVSFHSVLWVWPSLYIPCVPGRSGPLVIAAMLHQIWLAWQMLLSMPTILYPIGPEAWRGWQRILLYGRTYNITLALSYYTCIFSYVELVGGHAILYGSFAVKTHKTCDFIMHAPLVQYPHRP